MKSSVDVHNRLQELGIPHEFFKLSHPASSLEVGAEAEGVELKEIAKNEIYRADSSFVLVITPGDKRVDVDKLKAVLGANSVEKVGNDEVSALTGYHAGALPPVALLTEMPVYIDYFTLQQDVVYTGSGEMGTILKIRSYDLVRATDGEIADIVEHD